MNTAELRPAGALTARRRWLGWALAAIGVPLATIGCLAAQAALSLAEVTTFQPMRPRVRWSSVEKRRASAKGCS